MKLIDLTGRYRIARGRLDWARVDGGAFHHSVTRTPAASWDGMQELIILDAIDRYHREVKWRDWGGNLVSLGGFAYHLAVFPSGRVYLATPLGQRGAHVANHNGHLAAVVLIGTFTDRPPAPAQLAAAAEARAYVERELPGQLTWKGHRGWADRAHPTACPGATHAAWVPQLSMREEVRTVYTDDQINRRFIALGGRLARLEASVKKLGGRPAPAPKPGPRWYTVVSGDVAGLIAERHNLTWAAFKRLNPKGPRSGKWRLIHPGERFRVA